MKYGLNYEEIEKKFFTSYMCGIFSELPYPAWYFVVSELTIFRLKFTVTLGKMKKKAHD